MGGQLMHLNSFLNLCYALLCYRMENISVMRSQIENLSAKKHNVET